MGDLNSNYKLLVVEDEELIRTMIKLNLEKSGFTVYTANDGIKALEITKSEKFHLILLDIMLPGLKGKEVLAEIRKRGDNTPVIMVTANNEKEMTLKTFNLGADDYISKPFDMDELLVRVRAIIRRNLKK